MVRDDEELPPAGSYITPAGYKKLTSELDHLQRVERPKVVHEVAEAAAQGDRSENAEYIYGKKRLREIDRRMRFLQQRLDAVKVADPREHVGKKVVYFGARVTIEDENGRRSTYQLVGEDEIDSAGGRISLASPMGRALIRRTVGDTVLVRRPAGEVEVRVISVLYEG